MVIGSGCGGDPRQAKTPPAPKRSPTATATAAKRKPAAAADVAVIRGWTDELRRGHIEKASRYFAIPSVVSNGTPPIRLTSRSDVRFFNRTLPCGAKLVRAEDTGAFVLATFRLTERPGPGRCGASAVGHKAYTAFLIRRHKIVQWRRVLPPEPETTPAGPES
jgi:hypothetical protein